jgi:hypothetical protein
MVHIEQIKLTVITGNVTGASTNGHIFLGIGGREFRLNKSGNQFQKGDTDTFQIGGVIGPDSINNQNNSNDLPPLPGTINAPAIEYSTLDDYPTYIRFEPQDNDDNWNVQSVSGNVKESGASGGTRTFNDRTGNGNIWLGKESGLFLGLN